MTAATTWGEVLVSAPAAEPISTADAKTHLRVTGSDDDTYIDGLVTAARKWAEEVRGESLITTTWRYDVETFPAARYIELPRRPLASVTSVTYRPTGETSYSTMTATDYLTETSYPRGRVQLVDTASWPTSSLESGMSVRVTYVAGYGAAGSSVPRHILQALYLLIAHWYDRRAGLAGASNLPREVDYSMRALLDIDRMRHV